MNRKYALIAVFVALALTITACSAGTLATSYITKLGVPQAAATAVPTAPATQSQNQPSTANPTVPAVNIPNSSDTTAAAAIEGLLQNLYDQVNPSVVLINVTSTATTSQSPFGNSPFGNNPFGNQGSQVTQALGSGFVWDKQGHIVTNNHVVDGATTVDVTFSDGLTVPAKVVGTDVNSDLAVIKVDVPAERLNPVTLADSTKAKVGQLAVAIGNPYGEAGSMSVGIISGLSRSLPVNNSNPNSTTGSYTIPDILQTDAAINPGNSGGVLVDDQGHVLGVTAAIESNSNANSGVGFVIPSEIVSKVVPALISTGHYDHPWLGIAGTTMVPELATQMGLNSDQRGVLVEEVTAGSPASQAGIQGSNNQVTINGLPATVGGDVIVSIDGQSVKTFDDLVTYLERSTSVGQKITLGLLRNGKAITADVTLAARPNTNQSSGLSTPGQGQVTPFTAGAWLGISGADLNSQIDQAMNLPTGQQGILVEQVQASSPASDAGIQAGTQTQTINGQSLVLGGDVITAIDNHPVTSVAELRVFMQQMQPGDQVVLTIIRNGRTRNVPVTLGTTPASLQ